VTAAGREISQNWLHEMKEEEEEEEEEGAFTLSPLA
jgi:hypothetical protein